MTVSKSTLFFSCVISAAVGATATVISIARFQDYQNYVVSSEIYESSYSKLLNLANEHGDENKASLSFVEKAGAYRACGIHTLFDEMKGPSQFSDVDLSQYQIDRGIESYEAEK